MVEFKDAESFTDGRRGLSVGIRHPSSCSIQQSSTITSRNMAAPIDDFNGVMRPKSDLGVSSNSCVMHVNHQGRSL
jgi:hypothetical protein